jgi:hypothetical protein
MRWVAAGTTSERGAEPSRPATGLRAGLCQYPQGRGPRSPRAAAAYLARRVARWPRCGPDRGTSGHLGHRGYPQDRDRICPGPAGDFRDGLTVQTAVGLATGELWLFLLQFPLANLCMCVLFARTASGPRPLVAQLAGEVVALRQPADHHPGLHRFFQGATWLWAGIFLLLTAGLAVLMVTEPASMFLMLSTAATIALVAAGAAASAVWFLSVLRSLGLRTPFRPGLNHAVLVSPVTRWPASSGYAS